MWKLLFVLALPLMAAQPKGTLIDWYPFKKVPQISSGIVQPATCNAGQYFSTRVGFNWKFDGPEFICVNRYWRKIAFAVWACVVTADEEAIAESGDKKTQRFVQDCIDKGKNK